MIQELSKTQPLVIAVIVGYRNEERLVSRAQHLLGQSYPNLTVVAIDNGGHKPLRVYRVNDRLQLLSPGFNSGFAGACNLGIRVAMSSRAQFVFLLNDDAVPDKTCIDEMVTAMVARPDVGLLCPVVLSAGSDSVESAGGRFNPWFGLTLHNAKGRTHDSVKNSSSKIDFAPGTALMARMDALKKTGPFDERYFMYVEDLDLSYRMKAKGFVVASITRATVRHSESSTSRLFPGLRQYYMTRNQFLLCWIQQKRVHLVAITISMWAVLIMRILCGRSKASPHDMMGYVYGLLDGVRQRTGPTRDKRFTPP